MSFILSFPKASPGWIRPRTSTAVFTETHSLTPGHSNTVAEGCHLLPLMLLLVAGCSFSLAQDCTPLIQSGLFFLPLLFGPESNIDTPLCFLCILPQPYLSDPWRKCEKMELHTGLAFETGLRLKRGPQQSSGSWLTMEVRSSLSDCLFSCHPGVWRQEAKGT